MIESDLLLYLSSPDLEEQRVLKDAELYFLNRKQDYAAVNRYRAERYLPKNKPVRIIKNSRYIPVELHRHDFVEICYQFAGQTVHTVDKQEIVLSPGEFLMMNQFARQSILPAGENDLAVNILLRPDALNTVIGMMENVDSPTKRFLSDAISVIPGQYNYLHYKTGASPEPAAVANMLLYSYFNDRSNQGGVMQKAVGLLMLLLQNSIESVETFGRKENDRTVIEEYIGNNYVTASLHDLAALLRCDENSAGRKVKQLTGKTFMELAQQKRMEKAARLLGTTALSISDVAHAVGYENMSHFYRLFRQYYGALPSEYRNRS